MSLHYGLAIVIPGRRVAENPESITTDRDYGFRACAFGASRNDVDCVGGRA
jgi:hypothetical protein